MINAQNPNQKVSEQQILNLYFHSVVKGCKIIKRYYAYKGQTKKQGGYNRIIYGGYCKTHGVEICRDGWEWHWNGGEYHKPNKEGLYPQIQLKLIKKFK